MYLRRSAPLVIAVGLLAFALACKKKPAPGGLCPGDWFVKGMGVCADPSTFLYCNMQTFMAVPCKGPKGCTGTEPGPYLERCDISNNAPGDVCPPPPSIMGDRTYRMCRPSGNELTVCTGGEASKIEVLPCPGPGGCAGAMPAITCDDSIAKAGDACDPVVHQAIYTCSTDGHTLLACQPIKVRSASFHWEPARSCRGEKGCVRTLPSKNASCDSTRAEVGDPCERDGISACSGDRKAWLTCTSRKFAVNKECPKGCTSTWRDAATYDVRCE